MGLSVLAGYSAEIERGSIEASIGNTPLLRLAMINRTLPADVQVFAKAEYLNPGGSVKDRPALNMILEGERSGRLRPGMSLRSRESLARS